MLLLLLHGLPLTAHQVELCSHIHSAHSFHHQDIRGPDACYHISDPNKQSPVEGLHYRSIMPLVVDACEAPNAESSKIDHARIAEEVDVRRNPPPKRELSKKVGGLVISADYAASCQAPSDAAVVMAHASMHDCSLQGD